MNPLSLGQLCVERRLITEEQLEQCLEVQRTSPEWRRLGEILLSEGLITGRALANVLSIQEAERRRETEAPREAADDDVPPSELGWLLREARANGADGLVLGPGRPPVFRSRGGLEVLDGPPLKEGQVETMLAEAIPQGVVQEMERHGFAEAAVELGTADAVHVTVYRHAGGLGLSVEALDEEPVRDLASLGVPGGVRELARPGPGLALVTGPARSGKTTTLSALVQSIRAARACHMLVVENGRRLSLGDGPAFVSRRTVGRDAPSAAAALESALLAEADVVAVTGLEDHASIAAALALAQADRLVLATMPTPGAAATVTRLLDAAGESARPLLARCLRGVLSLRRFGSRRGKPAAVAVELMLASPGMANLVREGKPDQIATLLRTSGPEGMVSLEESLAKNFNKGRLTVTQALEAANDADALRKIIGIQQETIRVRR